MKKKDFIDAFVTIITRRLDKILPDEGSEGVFMFKAYRIVSRGLGHILLGKLDPEHQEEEGGKNGSS